MAFAVAAPAAAQPDVQQPSEVEAAAQAAFDEGMKLMEAGHYEQACERIAKSLELDPGMAAQFRLAECYEKLGHTASAWKNYNDVANAARAVGMQDREQVARSRASALKSRLSTLTIVVPDEVASVPGVKIKRGGVAVAQSMWNTPIPVDPGAVQVLAEAPGRSPWSAEVVIDGEGAAERVEVPPFDEPTGGGGTATADEGMSGQTIAGIVLAGVGAAAMAAGVIIGVAAKPRYDESNDYCQDDVCDQEGLDIRDSVRTQGNIATAVFVIGAAALVGGVVLWLTAPPGGGDEADVAQGDGGPSPVDVSLGLTPGGLLVQGTF
ncbi:MAG: hypothetical protein JRI23_11890 [Deltaproteobacteria bacterium]|jgi:hypothetical protein|nr:hypothetical protein [Deltaproteobacteria bacterium]MBW2532409.1 hypothetical protein [Deltaproteobacteria bacterium]